jgi:hypothetical protein
MQAVLGVLEDMCSITIDGSASLILQLRQRDEAQQVEIDSGHRPLPTQRSSRCNAGSGEATKSMM